MMSNSCVAPDGGDTHASKELNDKDILGEPMIARALKLFNPKRVQVKRNS